MNASMRESTSSKLFTVIVPSFRRFDWLERCIAALYQQSLASDLYDVIVVDNSLQFDVSEHFAKSLTAQYPLEYITAEKSGLSYARNIGINKAHTPYIACIDDDALADKNWLQEIYNFFENHPSCGVVGGKTLPIWEISKPEWLSRDLLYQLAIIDWGTEAFKIVDRSRWLVGANVAYRTVALKQIGGFSENLGRKENFLLAHEEYAANKAIQKLGYDIWYEPKISVQHLIQKERICVSFFYEDFALQAISKFIIDHNIAPDEQLLISLASEIRQYALSAYETQCDNSVTYDKVKDNYNDLLLQVDKQCSKAFCIDSPKKGSAMLNGIKAILPNYVRQILRRIRSKI